MLVEGRKGRIVTRNLSRIKNRLFEKESDFLSVIFNPWKNNVPKSQIINRLLREITDKLSVRTVRQRNFRLIIRYFAKLQIFNPKVSD